MNKSEYQTYLASREWALKREAVRTRSAGLCERCWTNSMDAVHHNTYERVGREEMTDLVAICNPCHEYLSAKRHDDPLTSGVKVYLAGSFETDWRHTMMKDPNGLFIGEEMVNGTEFMGFSSALRGGFDAIGPWKINRHGGVHGITTGHGGRFCACCSGPKIVDVCKKAILKADIVFAWLASSYKSIPAGTLWELGYACASGCHVVVAQEKNYLEREFGDDEDAPFWGDNDFWFAIEAADQRICANTPSEAWDKFISTEWAEYKKYIARRSIARWSI